MLYSFTVLGLVDGAGILSGLSVQFQETRCASRRSIKTGFPGPNWRARPHKVLGQARFLHGDGNYYVKARLHFSSPFRDGNLSGDPAICTIYVHTLTGKKWSMKVRPGDTVLALKQKIRDTEGIPVAQQRLIFSQQQLADGSRLYDLKIFDGATVHVVLRPRVAN